MTICGNAQDDYHPLIRTGLEWDVFYLWGGELCATSAARYFFGSDTAIDGNVYSKIMSYPIVSEFDDPFCPPYYVDNSNVYETDQFLREDVANRKVYIHDGNSPEEYGDELLYDFNLEPGDTLHSQYAGLGQTLVIDSVDSLTLLTGEVRKRFNLTNGEFYVESVGGGQGLQFFLIGTVNFAFSAHCMFENGQPVWHGPAGSNCFGVLSSGDPIENVDFDIFPNPATDLLTLELKSPIAVLAYSIMDITGKTVLKETIGDNIT